MLISFGKDLKLVSDHCYYWDSAWYPWFIIGAHILLNEFIHSWQSLRVQRTSYEIRDTRTIGKIAGFNISSALLGASSLQKNPFDISLHFFQCFVLFASLPVELSCKRRPGYDRHAEFFRGRASRLS